jgi:hypothetical protein
MSASLNPNSDFGPAGDLVVAGVLVIVAMATLISAVHPRWRGKGRWTGGYLRSAFGSGAAIAGLLIMASAFVLRFVQNQQGSPAGAVLWLYICGLVFLVAGPVVDLVRGIKDRSFQLRVMQLICLLVCFAFLLVRKGEPFTHCLEGIFFAGLLIACGLANIYGTSSPTGRLAGRILAVLGLILVLWLGMQLPAAYRAERELNQQSRTGQELQVQLRPPSQATK